MPPTRDTARARRTGPQGTPEGTAPVHGPGRRSLLAGAAAALGATGLAAGCTGDDGTTDQRQQVDATRRLRRAAVRDSEVLLARYDGTALAHPALAARLKPLREEVTQHLAAFGTGRPGRGRRRRGNGTAVPPDEAAALAALANAERRTADARTRDLADAPPEFARLLASMAASGAVHAFLLTEGDA